MKKLLSRMAVAVVAVAAAAILWQDKSAARPGPLHEAHGELSDCTYCHVPWKGPSEEQCLACHDFSGASLLAPRIRFHAEERFCLACHREHLGENAKISAMNHHVLNPDLSCALCHRDIHKGRFGADCRECHRMGSFRVRGYTHPGQENRECHRCHPPPASHLDPAAARRILAGHETAEGESAESAVRDCHLCHVTHDWGELLTRHEIASGPESGDSRP